jgi:Pyruvate/2-oxoacid:ferredoxin oxidoreductase gamma subunit
VFSFLRVDEKKILLKCEIKRPDQINTAILGAYCRAAGDVPLACLEEAIRGTVPAKAALKKAGKPGRTR